MTMAPPPLHDDLASSAEIEEASCTCTTGSFAALVIASSTNPTSDPPPSPRPGFMNSPEVKSLSEKQKKAKEKAQAVVTLLKSKR